MERKPFIKFSILYVSSSEETRNRRNVPHHNKAIYDKPTANITRHERKRKSFPLKLGTRQSSILPLLFNTVVQFLSWARRQEKKIKEVQIEKEEVKLSPLADDMILFLRTLKILPKNSRSYKHFEQLSRIFNQHTEIHRFSIYQWTNWERNQENNFIYSTSKNKILRYELNHRDQRLPQWKLQNLFF
jgi:hypothetical protein